MSSQGNPSSKTGMPLGIHHLGLQEPSVSCQLVHLAHSQVLPAFCDPLTLQPHCYHVGSPDACHALQALQAGDRHLLPLVVCRWWY